MKSPGLSVFHGTSRVGELKVDPKNGDFSFEYDSAWRGFFLSPHIRPNHPSPEGAVTRFFENLLPEGTGLAQLARAARVARSNIFGLIAAIGGETTGALTLTAAPREQKTEWRPIAQSELAARIKTRDEKPITVWDGKPRLSLAGVQEKLAVMVRKNQFGFGEGALASTHILKFGGKKATSLVLNEAYCMKLARAVGIDVPEVELLDLGERVLLVKRFDRNLISPKLVERLHIFDGCQALDLAPSQKYERLLGDHAEVADFVGPATLANMYKFCAQTEVPARNQLKLLRWVLFNLLVGNSDSHVKNISFFAVENGMQLTPFYDLVSVAMYPEFEQALAFHVGDTFYLDEVNAYHLAEMSAELGLKKVFVAAQLKKLAQNTLKNLDLIDLGPLTRPETGFIAKLKAQIKARTGRLLAEVPKIAKFTSI